MNFNQLELNRETMFKDAVLAQAEATSMSIIADAHAEGAEELRKARLLCKQADEAALTAQIALQYEKEYSSMTQNMRRELIGVRTQMVDGMFAEIEQRINEFTKGKGYAGFLAKKLAAYGEVIKKSKKLTLYLREEDMKQTAALTKGLANIPAEADNSIKLGGFKLADGGFLYDETLDEALREEKQRFYDESGLNV